MTQRLLNRIYQRQRLVQRILARQVQPGRALQRRFIPALLLDSAGWPSAPDPVVPFTNNSPADFAQPPVAAPVPPTAAEAFPTAARPIAPRPTTTDLRPGAATPPTITPPSAAQQPSADQFATAEPIPSAPRSMATDLRPSTANLPASTPPATAPVPPTHFEQAATVEQPAPLTNRSNQAEETPPPSAPPPRRRGRVIELPVDSQVARSIAAAAGDRYEAPAAAPPAEPSLAESDATLPAAAQPLDVRPAPPPDPGMMASLPSDPISTQPLPRSVSEPAPPPIPSPVTADPGMPPPPSVLASPMVAEQRPSMPAEQQASAAKPTIQPGLSITEIARMVMEQSRRSAAPAPSMATSATDSDAALTALPGEAPRVVSDQADPPTTTGVATRPDVRGDTGPTEQRVGGVGTPPAAPELPQVAQQSAPLIDPLPPTRGPQHTAVPPQPPAPAGGQSVAAEPVQRRDLIGEGTTSEPAMPTVAEAVPQVPVQAAPGSASMPSIPNTPEAPQRVPLPATTNTPDPASAVAPPVAAVSETVAMADQGSVPLPGNLTVPPVPPEAPAVVPAPIPPEGAQPSVTQSVAPPASRQLPAAPAAPRTPAEWAALLFGRPSAPPDADQPAAAVSDTGKPDSLEQQLPHPASESPALIQPAMEADVACDDAGMPETGGASASPPAAPNRGRVLSEGPVTRTPNRVNPPPVRNTARPEKPWRPGDPMPDDSQRESSKLFQQTTRISPQEWAAKLFGPRAQPAPAAEPAAAPMVDSASTAPVAAPAAERASIAEPAPAAPAVAPAAAARVSPQEWAAKLFGPRAQPAPAAEPAPPTPLNQAVEPMPGRLPQQVALPTQGEPLRDATRRFLRPLVGIDPADVTIARDAQAATLTNRLGVDGVSDGDRIALGPGHTDEQRPETLGLLAHELTHAAARRGVRFVPPMMAAPPAANEEQQARAVEAQAIQLARQSFASTGTLAEPSAATRPPAAAASSEWGGLPAPWEPFPQWVVDATNVAQPSPAAASPNTALPADNPAPASPTVPGVAPTPSAAPSAGVYAAEPERRVAANESATPDRAEQEQEAPTPDLDLLARQVYEMLKQRLATERRRLGG